MNVHTCIRRRRCELCMVVLCAQPHYGVSCQPFHPRCQSSTSRYPRKYRTLYLSIRSPLYLPWSPPPLFFPFFFLSQLTVRTGIIPCSLLVIPRIRPMMNASNIAHNWHGAPSLGLQRLSPISSLFTGIRTYVYHSVVTPQRSSDKRM